MRLSVVSRTSAKAAAEVHSICDLLQLFIITTIIGCPFSVHCVEVAAMSQNSNTAASGTSGVVALTPPTDVKYYATFATATPSEMPSMVALVDSSEIDNSYYADYVMANQQTQATTAATTTTKTATINGTTTTAATTIKAASELATAAATAAAALDLVGIEKDAGVAVVAVAAAQPNAKTQDLLSLSLLSLNETTSTTSLTSSTAIVAAAAAVPEKNALSHRSLKGIERTGRGGNVIIAAATTAATFQQIGAQKIALKPSIATDYSDSGGGGGGNGVAADVDVDADVGDADYGHSHSHDSNNNYNLGAIINNNNSSYSSNNIGGIKASNTSNFRTSAKKVVENKYILPKPQKTDAPMLNYIFDTHSAANKHHHHDQRYGPHFEDVQRLGQMTNMTVQAGSSIHLNCRISLLQDKTVSWVRRNAQGEKNALDLLTVGLHTYTGDKRYKMEFQYPNNWRLKIINVKKTDEALYECQISTHPPRVIQINLHVNAPKVMIVDEYGDPLQEKYYEIDSTLQLSCVVRNVAMVASVVYWKHGKSVLNYDVTRGGVSVKTELMDDGANSTLFIAKINKSDSGNYTCSISEFQNFTIVVHILNGESFAELHHGGAATLWYSRRAGYILIFIFLLLYYPINLASSCYFCR